MEAAMRECSQKYDFRVRWEPFLLRPDMPKEGIPKAEPVPGNPRVAPRLKAAGEAVGIDFTGKCDRYPNTIAAHALLEYAASVKDGALQDDLQEALFQAYFTDGLYPDEQNLLNIAGKVGLDVQECKQVLNDERKLSTAREKALGWSAKGVTGVPMFYMNGKQTFSGAQEVNTFVKNFEIIATKFPLSGGAQSANT